MTSSTRTHTVAAFVAGLLFCLSLMASSLVAQEDRPNPSQPQGENLAFPEGWQVILDHPSEHILIGDDKDEVDVWFVNMTPGWHITTRPAAIFFHPANTGYELYRLEVTIHLFDPEGGNEGYGIFFGGKKLGQENGVFDSFLLRNSGEFSIRGKVGDFHEAMYDWTPHSGIVRFDETSEGSVENRLALDVDTENVHFEINGQRVATLSRDEVESEGIAGFRLGHLLNVHISDFQMFRKEFITELPTEIP